MSACSRVLDENKYAIAVGSFHGDLSFEEERIVIFYPLNQTVSCSCGIFNRTGILCAHGLKVLDLMNIKTLPPHYILKRWTREACKGNIQDRQGRNVVANPKLQAQLRWRSLSHKFLNMAYKAANYPDCCLLLDKGLDYLGTQIDDKLNASATSMNKSCNDQENIDPNVQQSDELFSEAQLKKKEGKPKNSKRKKTWIEKLQKKKRKPAKSAIETKKGEKDGDSNKEAIVEFQQPNIIGSFGSFTRLLTDPSCCNDGLCDEDFF
ncbi:hypothetical protein BS78_06G142800 [Paspalum vaginatum]|nr:hypothetical protein BS78_06G142800 [Paspalum vaginatum]